MSKHTPGPWSAHNHVIKNGMMNGGDWAGHIEDNKGRGLAVICFNTSTPEKGKVSQKEAEANLKLISAAPDLLEACKAALELIKTLNGVWPKEEKFLRDAILKAEAQE